MDTSSQYKQTLQTAIIASITYKVPLFTIDVVSGARLLRHTLQNGFTICKWKNVDTFSVEMMMDRKYNR